MPNPIVRAEGALPPHPALTYSSSFGLHMHRYVFIQVYVYSICVCWTELCTCVLIHGMKTRLLGLQPPITWEFSGLKNRTNWGVYTLYKLPVISGGNVYMPGCRMPFAVTYFGMYVQGHLPLNLIWDSQIVMGKSMILNDLCVVPSGSSSTLRKGSPTFLLFPLPSFLLSVPPQPPRVSCMLCWLQVHFA